MACIGVDQQLGYRFRPGDRALLVGEAVSWVPGGFPGCLRVSFTDATGPAWFLVDKVPVFTEADIVTATAFPVPVTIRSIVQVDGSQPEDPVTFGACPENAGRTNASGWGPFMIGGYRLGSGRGPTPAESSGLSWGEMTELQVKDIDSTRAF